MEAEPAFCLVQERRLPVTLLILPRCHFTRFQKITQGYDMRANSGSFLKIAIAITILVCVIQQIAFAILYGKYQHASKMLLEQSEKKETDNIELSDKNSDKKEPIKFFHVSSPLKCIDGYVALWIPPEPANPAKNVSVRNKNPFNVKRLGKGEKWAGQIGVDRQGHAIFSSWEYGIRAAALTLRSYSHRYNIDTVEKLVDRFAQSQGKDRDTYISYIRRRLGVSQNEKIDLITRLPSLLRIMARYESGVILPDELFAGYDILEKLE